MRILADQSLTGLVQAFPKPFELTFYKHHQEIPSLLQAQDVLLCRASLKVNETLLQGSSLTYVATASSGTDHIDANYLETKAIQLIDAKGSNAPAVADYVVACLAYLQKYKDLRCTNAGLIGLGEVGSRVSERLKAAGMRVFFYDPPKAAADPNFISHPLEILKECDLIAIHANLHDTNHYPSRNLLDAKLLSQLKPGTVIINAARGGIVDEDALLLQHQSLIYCTDVYNNEPAINKKIVELATLCTPHIAGHSIEAKFTAIRMISEKLHAALKLKPPVWQSAAKIKVSDKPLSADWQDLILSLYNPIHETTALKASSDELSFQNLRKAHQNRHDFCNYELNTGNKQIDSLLGLSST